MRALGPGIAAAALLSACATASAPPTSPAFPDTALSPTARLALDLAAADAAFAAGETQRLAAMLPRIEGRNPRPLDAGAPDPVAAWRAALPDTPPPLRGRALGPGYVRGTLAAGAARRMDQLFLSGQAATIAASSTPRQAMRLRIFDAAGALVCDRAPAHARDCRFTPVFTQRYRIELSNGGTKSARFYLVVD